MSPERSEGTVSPVEGRRFKSGQTSHSIDLGRFEENHYARAFDMSVFGYCSILTPARNTVPYRRSHGIVFRGDARKILNC